MSTVDKLNYLKGTKLLMEEALIEQGQEIGENDTFRDYASKIRAIETGIDTSDATATANDIISPETAYVDGEKITGAIVPTYGPVTFNDLHIDSETMTYQNMVDISYIGNVAAKFGNNGVEFYKIVNGEIDMESVVSYDFTTLEISSAVKSTIKFANELNPDGTLNTVIITYSKTSSSSSGNVTVYVCLIRLNVTDLTYQFKSILPLSIGTTNYYSLNCELNVVDRNKFILTKIWDHQSSSYTNIDYKLNIFAIKYDYDTNSLNNTSTKVASIGSGYGGGWAGTNTISCFYKDNKLCWNAHRQHINSSTNSGAVISYIAEFNDTFTQIEEKLKKFTSSTSTNNIRKQYILLDDNKVLVTDTNKVYNIDDLNNSIATLSYEFSNSTSLTNRFIIYCLGKYYAIYSLTTDEYKVYEFNSANNEFLLQNELTMTITNAQLNRNIQNNYIQNSFTDGTNISKLYFDTTESTVITSLTRQNTPYHSTLDTTATVNDILSPKTAYIGGQKVTGVIVPHSTVTSSDLVAGNRITKDTSYTIQDISYIHNLALIKTNTRTLSLAKIVNNEIDYSNMAVLSFDDLEIASGYTIADAKLSRGGVNEPVYVYVAYNLRRAGSSGAIVYSVNMIKTTYDDVNNIFINTFTKTISTPSLNQSTAGAINGKIMIYPRNNFDMTNIVISSSAYKSNLISISLLDDTFTRIKHFTTTATNVNSAVTPNCNGYWNENGTVFCGFTTQHPQSTTFANIVMYYDGSQWNTRTYSGATIASRLAILDNTYYYYNSTGLYRLSTGEKVATISTTLNQNDNYFLVGDLIVIQNASSFDIYSFDEENFTFTKLRTVSRYNNGNFFIDSGKVVIYEDADRKLSTLTYDLASSVLTSFTRNGTEYYNPYNADIVAGDVLNGKIAYNKFGVITGTMPNNGAITITPTTSNQTIPAGYTSGGTVDGDANLVTGNIKSGTSIFGVSGKSSVVDTDDADALAEDIIAGKTAYVNGVKVTGTYGSIPDTELEYIQSTGTQYIDTGIKANSRHINKIKFKVVQYDDNQSLNPVCGGYYNDGTQKAYRLYYSITDDCFRFQYGASYYDVSNSIMTKNNDVYEVVLGDGLFSCNGSMATTYNSNFNTNVNYYLFQTRAIDTVEDVDRMEYPTDGVLNIYRYTVIDRATTEVLLDLVPIKRKSDDVICMYDKVSGTYFENQGTGDFIAGPEV